MSPPLSVTTPPPIRRAVPGRVNTATGAILAGTGFTVTKNGVGDVTITFTTPFFSVPTAPAIVETIGLSGTTIVLGGPPTVAAIRYLVTAGNLGPQDAVIDFIAMET